MRDFHVLQTEVNLMMDLTGRRMRTWGRSSGGREAHITSSIKDLETSGELSDIATSFKHRERLTLRLQQERSASRPGMDLMLNPRAAQLEKARL